MLYRKLGKTGIEVSEIGFGAWGIGGVTNGATSYGKTDDERSRDALWKAFESGITFYDTSDLYGYGHSESLIGEVFQGHRDRIVIASKVGFIEHNGPQDFSASHVRKSIEGSLRRLRTDYVDLYQLHSPKLEDVESDRVVDTLTSLKREGKIRAFGISARSPADALIAVDRYNFDAIQVNFNLVDQRAVENGLFALCAQKGVGVICRTPLCFGFLAGQFSPDVKFDPTDHRSTWPQEQIARWAEAYKLFAEAVREGTEQSYVQLALRFCLSSEGVSSVIPGMLSVSEVEENAAASRLGPFAAAEMEKLSEIHRQNAFFICKKQGGGA
jgi:aryl-alcohol dehydrogenase-like predicted oxidoreductase